MKRRCVSRATLVMAGRLNEALAKGKLSLTYEQYESLVYLLFGDEAHAMPMPTACLAGSRRKVEVMSRRADSGLPIFHPCDASGMAPPEERDIAGQIGEEQEEAAPGVHLERGKWIARRTTGGKKRLGSYRTRQEAEQAVARDAALQKNRDGIDELIETLLARTLHPSATLHSWSACVAALEAMRSMGDDRRDGGACHPAPATIETALAATGRFRQHGVSPPARIAFRITGTILFEWRTDDETYEVRIVGETIEVKATRRVAVATEMVGREKAVG